MLDIKFHFRFDIENRKKWAIEVRLKTGKIKLFLLVWAKKIIRHKRVRINSVEFTYIIKDLFWDRTSTSTHPMYSNKECSTQTSSTVLPVIT